MTVLEKQRPTGSQRTAGHLISLLERGAIGLALVGLVSLLAGLLDVSELSLAAAAALILATTLVLLRMTDPITPGQRSELTARRHQILQAIALVEGITIVLLVAGFALYSSQHPLACGAPFPGAISPLHISGFLLAASVIGQLGLIVTTAFMLLFRR